MNIFKTYFDSPDERKKIIRFLVTNRNAINIGSKNILVYLWILLIQLGYGIPN